VGPECGRRFPEAEAYVRLLKYPGVLAMEDKMFEEKNFLYADAAFFSLFSFSLLAGNPATVLNALEKVWKQRVAYSPLEYQFLDE
jgi:putative ABC transport system permease protein